MTKRVFIFLVLSISYAFSQQEVANRFLLGQSFEQSGEFEKAKQIFEELYKEQPANFQYFDALNRVYLQLKEYDNSIKIIENRLKTNETDINLYGQLGKTHYLKGDEKEAFDIWDEALKKLPNNQVNYRTIANYAIERRAFEKAIEYLNKGKSISDNPRMFSYDLANIYSLTMRFRDAAKEYCEIISMNPSQYRFIESRVLSYIRKPDALSQTIDIVKEYRTSDIVAFDYLLARLYMEDNKLDKAFQIYLGIDDKQNDQGSDLNNFANFAFSENEFELAAKVYKELIARHPNSQLVSSAKLGYAKTLEEVLDEEYAANNNSWKPFYKVETFDRENMERVISAYEELISLYPRSEVAAEGLLRIGELVLNNGNDVSSAETYFNRMVKEYPLSRFIFNAYLDLAKINILKNDFDEAERNLFKVINNKSAGEDKRNIAKYELAKVNFYLGKFDAAKDRLGEILSNMKDNIANDAIELSLLLNTTLNDSSSLLLFAKGELLITQGKYREASDMFQEIVSNKRGFVLQNKARLKEAEAELAMDNYYESIAILGKITAEEEKNVYADKALYLLGKIYQYGLKDDSKAVEVYESLLAKFPNSLYLDTAREEIIKIRDKVS
jgi:tetratricopeptide (TPR) repeat protein